MAARNCKPHVTRKHNNDMAVLYHAGNRALAPPITAPQNEALQWGQMTVYDQAPRISSTLGRI